MNTRSVLLSATVVGLSVLAGVAGCAGTSKRTKTAIDANAPVTIARVDGAVLDSAALDAHVKETGLARDVARDDLIDLMLLRAAADKAKITVPATWSKEERARVEYEVAIAQAIAVEKAKESVIVDHAWVKDAKAKKARDASKAQIEKLRALVETGKTIPVAFAELKIPPALWHIGDHEEYPIKVVPEEVRQLKAGTLSPVAVGDGGLHLFQIYEQKRVLPEAGPVHSLVQPKLRAAAKIELVAK